VRVDLGDVEGLRKVPKGGRVELDAIDVQRVLVLADLEVKQLVRR
jgi:hypothetical protein